MDFCRLFRFPRAPTALAEWRSALTYIAVRPKGRHFGNATGKDRVLAETISNGLKVVVLHFDTFQESHSPTCREGAGEVVVVDINLTQPVAPDFGEDFGNLTAEPVVVQIQMLDPRKSLIALSPIQG